MRQAVTCHVLNAEDAQIIEEDNEAQQERDLVLFRRWHHKRGTDSEAALEKLRRRTGGYARELAEEHERRRKASPAPLEQPELDPK
ncbi:MAG: hypothetical protein M3317_01180 [Actinomycetota bacterium]|nr:hypothetical protein [Actinomycetota bacterium]